MRRRTLAVLAAASTLAASAVARPALAGDSGDGGSRDPLQGGNDGGGLGTALQAYLALPGTKSYLIHVGPGGSLGRIAHRPDHFLFTVDCFGATMRHRRRSS
jgi:hypothetical protein